MYKFYEFFTPVLEAMQNGKTYSRNDVTESVGQLLKLTDEQKHQTIKSGKPVYADRAQWAMTYLKQAGALINEKRGEWQISERGLGLLASGETVTLDTLSEFPEFVEFKQRTGARKKSGIAGDVIDDAALMENTPGDLIEAAFGRLQSSLQDELITSLKEMDPFQFEKVVKDVLKAMGYGKAHVTKKSNDGGVDAIVDEDTLGLSKIYAQAKRYTDAKVQEKEIRHFVGAMEVENVDKGVFVTTSDYSDKARELVRRISKSIILINGDRLTELMIEYGVGVSVMDRYEVKRIDTDYFVQ